MPSDIIHHDIMDPHESSENDAMDPLQNNRNGEVSGLRAVTHKPDDKTRPNGPHEEVNISSKLGGTDSTQKAQKPASETNLTTEAEMEQSVRQMVEDFGPDRFAVFVYLGLIGIAIISIFGFFLLSWSWITAIICVFIGFVAVRSLPLPLS